MKRFRIVYLFVDGTSRYPAGEFNTYSDAREVAQINRNNNPRIAGFTIVSG